MTSSISKEKTIFFYEKVTFEVYKAHLAPLHLDGLIGGLIALQLHRASLQYPQLFSAFIIILFANNEIERKNTPDIFNVVQLRLLTSGGSKFF